jgi:type I restriction enzyme S subunit
MKQIANEKARGIGVKNLNVGDVRKFLIPIPPLPQQEKIVKILDISSQLIEKQKELIADYDLFLKSKFIEMFGDPIQNPMGWEVEKLDKFATLVSSGSTPKGGQSSYLDEGEIRFIRSQNVRMNKMDYNGIYYISEELYTKMKRSQVKYNDVLLNITGASIGRTAIYKDTTRANVNQHVCIIRLTEELNNEYLSFMISTDSFQNQIISNQSGATREALNYSQIKKFNIPYPPIDLQNKFAQIVEKIETIKTKETQKLEHLEILHKSLMDKAFKGEIK